MGGGRGRGRLTVGVILLPDSVHDPVGLDPQEEAAVFAVQPFGVLEAAGRKAAAAAVFRCGWERGDPSRGHLLLLRVPLLAGECSVSSSRAGAPSEASRLPLTICFLPSSTRLLTVITSPQRSTPPPPPVGSKSPPTPLALESEACSVVTLSHWWGDACGPPLRPPFVHGALSRGSWIRSVWKASPFGPQFACALGAPPPHMRTPTSARGFNQPRS